MMRTRAEPLHVVLHTLRIGQLLEALLPVDLARLLRSPRAREREDE
jgi:hypothetical protein